MTLGNRALFWLAAFVALCLFLWLVSGILLPFVAGIALAYFLNPVAEALQKEGMSRLGASLLILLAFIIITAAIIISVAPLIGEQLVAFSEQLPNYIQQAKALVTRLSQGKLGTVINEQIANAEVSIGDVAKQGVGVLGGLANRLWSGGQALLSVLALLVVTPVVAFYLLLDWPKMVKAVDDALPRAHLDTLRGLAREIDAAIAGFVRGQGSVCGLLAVFYAVGLSLTGLHFGLLIGVFIGALSFIPYVGSTIGFVTAISVAVFQFWPSYWPIVAVAGVFMAGQFIEGNILQPKLVGESVGLHPVWLMFALFAFGSFFGFVGMLLAVPLAAVIGVVVRFFIQEYKASKLYSPHPTSLIKPE